MLLDPGRFNIALLLSAGLVLLVAMTVHEFAHNYVGYRMGDPTPRDMGRLTLNPFVHINWVGWLMWVVVGFGILGSAPISEYRMKDRRWGYLLAVAAGPLSNLALAVIMAIIFRLNLVDPYPFFGPRDIIPNLGQLAWQMFNLNLLLFVFNLLPFFPFDGWHILRKLLPPQQAYWLERYQNESMYVFLFLLICSFLNVPVLGGILNALILQPIVALQRILLGI